MIKAFFDLDVYRLSSDYSMKVYFLTKAFPKSETYSLTSQIIGSARSICANIAEGWVAEFMKVNLKSFLFIQWGLYKKLNPG